MPKNRRHYRVGLADVIDAHDKALKFGGLGGILDLGLIESAIGRPYSGYYRGVAEKVAALVFSLAKNHGFVDGNKRTAVYIMHLFLERSGYELRVDDEREVADTILAVAASRMGHANLVAWFKARVRRR